MNKMVAAKGSHCLDESMLQPACYMKQKITH